MPNWHVVFPHRGVTVDPSLAHLRLLQLVRYLEWAQGEPLPRQAASLP